LEIEKNNKMNIVQDRNRDQKELRGSFLKTAIEEYNMMEKESLLKIAGIENKIKEINKMIKLLHS